MSARLFLCEKPSQARDIARVLGAGEKRDGYLAGPGTIVTWCFGHLLEMAKPEDYDPVYRRWSLEALPIVPERWRATVRKDARKQFGIIERLLKKAGEVVIATDADREGEAIAREVLERANWRGPIARLWLSALDEASIRKALGDIWPGSRTESLYRAAVARSRADWLVGMNLSRAYTCAARAAGGEAVLSVGRVQTPTLKLVVDRDRAIEQFQPIPYYDVQAEFQVRAGRFTAKWSVPEDRSDPEGRCLRKDWAEAVVRRVTGQTGVIAAAETKRVQEPPPLPLDLGTLQQEASKRFGLGAQVVLEAAQALYETHKAATYPRTDCPYLPASQHGVAAQVLAALKARAPEYEGLADRADLSRRSRAWNDAKITAHHAIIPTATKTDPGRFSQAERQVHDLICRRYLAQFYPPHAYDKTVIHVDVQCDRFQASGRIERVAGWKAVFGRDGGDKPDEPALPHAERGEPAKVLAADVKTLQTKPPPRFTEGTLIAAMKSIGRWVEDPRLKKVLRETAGIGTEATRAAILETLFKRGFLVREGKQHVLSTPPARALIDALPEAVKDPALTAAWEQALEEIAQGKRAAEPFIAQQANAVAKLIVRLKAEIGQSAALSGLKQGPDHPCPVCGKPLRRRKGAKGLFWGCTGYPDCKATLPD
ncbi:MAG: DNA topoisomerase III, partial [Rhodobacteraceae bacterium]|nr:DNA topoisomerase III [Paracoccaceae bacterium]